MPRQRQVEDPGGIPERVRDTADSFVALVAAHFKVANLELVADLHSRTSRLAVQLAIAVVALVGYVILMVGVAFAVVPWAGRPGAFALVGAAHLAAALIASVVIGLQRRRVPGTRQVLASIGRSVATVADAVTDTVPPEARPEAAHAAG